ncbi:MAG TPA: oligosaccharide flippase family protein [Candidatus Olsenella excrementigallinarum]|nr:oligosaccharide flippase family protein [Candidatus Olsenella excrementigallinarum]
MGEARRLIKNTGIIAVGGMATKLVQFLLLPLYTSVLPPTEYGAVDYLNTIALFCVPVASLLMDEALFRFLIDCETEEDRRRAVTATVGVLALGCVLFAALMGVLELVFHPDSFWWIVGLVYAGTMLQMVSALLRGFGDTMGYSLANFLASAVMIVLNVLFIAVFRWGVEGMLSATVIAQGGVALVFAVRKRVWRYVDLGLIDRAYMGRLIRYAVPLVPNKVSWTIMNMLDRLVIMVTLGPGAAGLYAVAYKFPNVMDQVYGFFYQSWKESSARSLNAEGDEVDFYDAIYRMLRRFMMSVVLGMTALMPLVYDLMIDWQYHEGILYVPILLLATFFSNISGFYGGIFTAHKDTKIMGTTTIVSALLCLVLNLVLIPSIGLYGASVATLASMFVVNEYRRVKVRAYARLTEDRREQVLTLLCFALVFGLFYVQAYVGGWWPLVGSIVVAAAFFVCANWTLMTRALAVSREVLVRRGDE